jgi:SAM-dependent methyltransferase
VGDILIRGRTLAIVVGAAAASAALVVRRHMRGAMGTHVPGGILVPDVALYDAIGHGFLLRSLLRRVAVDVAAATSTGAKVLEVGCGPGRLSIRLAREHDLDVTGLDLDPEMIRRAEANAVRGSRDGHGPVFMIGDVASMPFPDGSFDLVVSTLSLHHWADPSAGLAEIARVLRPGGGALIWDLRPGRIPLHGHLADPIDDMSVTSLQLIDSARWTWPWPFRLLRRLELALADPDR